MTKKNARRAIVAVLATAVVTAAGLLASTAGAASASRAARPVPRPKPTVVLVHGAWADSSSWDGVIRRLLNDGYPVRDFPTPLQSLSGDSGALRDYLGAISGPIILVGHSYGGAVVTDAATDNPSVKALVYIDAFAPEQGQAVATLAGPDSVLANPDPTQVFSFVPAAAPTPATDFYILPNVFISSFANDLPVRRAQVLAVTQRPITLLALSQPSTTPAWATIPSWYEVGTIDKVIPPSAQLAMAHTAHSHIVEVRSSHLPMVSQPRAVTRTIEDAAKATG